MIERVLEIKYDAIFYNFTSNVYDIETFQYIEVEFVKVVLGCHFPVERLSVNWEEKPAATPKGKVKQWER